LGVVGELHPRWVQAWEFPQAPIVFELSAELLLNHTVAKFHEVSKQPSVQRDLAFVVDRTVPAQQLKNSVLLACQPFMRILKSVILFDEFVSEEGATQEAKGMKSNEKSLCFRLVFQDQTSSLTEADVEPVIQQVLAQAAAMCGARLRSFTTNAG
jgi:phenylalanyl-tRNA synthetase beta chain